MPRALRQHLQPAFRAGSKKTRTNLSVAPRDSVNSASSPEPAQSAKAAGLRYVTDTMPGIRRVRRGQGFSYLTSEGKPLRDPDDLQRIKALVLPPAWTDVWICPLPHGHLQATGRDAKGRKQHRYHERWKAVRDATKFDRMIAFAQALPRLRRRIDRDLKRRGLTREKVLATVVRLLETSLIRVGNEEYAQQNDSFGLTTLRDRHVDVRGSRMRFEFRGKSGVAHSVDVHDLRLAKVVQSCQELPGHELFQYIDDTGERRAINSSDVNDYLRQITRQDFTSKDFRTWAATLLAARALQECEAFDSQAEAKRHLVRAIESVAERLGNTPTVCRKCYVHPAIIDAYLNRTLLETLAQRADTELVRSLQQLTPEEAAVLALLQQRLRREAQESDSTRRRRAKSPARTATS